MGFGSLAVLTLLVNSTDTALVELGKPAPEFGPVSLVQGGKGELSLKNYKGKVLVVEFFATWCGPCRKFLPHLNGLSKAFPSSKVAFLAISPESESDLREGLKEMDFAFPVGKDQYGASFARYKLNGIPATAVIDSNGVLRAFTHPENVTKKAIQEVIDGRPIFLPFTAMSGGTVANWDPRAVAPSEGDLKPKVEFKPTAEEARSGLFSPFTGEIKVPGGSIESLIRSAFDLQTYLVEVKVDDSLKKQYFDVHIVPADKNLSTSKALLRSALETTLKLDIKLEPREMDAWVLRRIEGASLPPESSSPVTTVTLMSVRVAGELTLGEMGNWLAYGLGGVGIDETGTGGKRYTLNMTFKDSIELKRVLADNGLRLDKERKTFNVTVVLVGSR